MAVPYTHPIITKLRKNKSIKYTFENTWKHSRHFHNFIYKIGN